jgi:hypothetical protein
VPDTYCYETYVVDLLNGYCYKAGSVDMTSYTYNDFVCKFVTYPVFESDSQVKAFVKLLDMGENDTYLDRISLVRLGLVM